MPPVVVFDTNVLLSAVGWRGVPYQCLECARSGVVCGLTCREILDELTAKLETKLRFSEAHLAETLADLLSFLGVVEISGELRVIAADPADDKILETAVNARATHVVTGDRRHLLPLQADHGIAIVTPRELLTLLGQQPRGSLV